MAKDTDVQSAQAVVLAPERTLSPKQKRVYDLLVNQDKSPAQISKVMKISVNGVYGHMRRIEQHGIDLSAFRSSNGRPKNGQAKKSRSRSRRSRNGVISQSFRASINREKKRLDGEAASVFKQIDKLDARHKTLIDARADLDRISESV